MTNFLIAIIFLICLHKDAQCHTIVKAQTDQWFEICHERHQFFGKLRKKVQPFAQSQQVWLIFANQNMYYEFSIQPQIY